MAISFIANALGATNSTTSFSITLPTTAAGDIIILEFCHRGTGDGTIGGTYDGPALALKHSQLFASSAFSGKTYWSRATGDRAGQTVTGSSLTNSCAAIVTVYRGALASGDPLADATIVGEQNASGNETQAEITTATDGAWVVLVVVNSPDLAVSSQSCTSPGALTERAERLSSGGTDSSIAHAGARKAVAGGTGAFTWSQNNAASGSWAYALTPAPITGTLDVTEAADTVVSSNTLAPIFHAVSEIGSDAFGALTVFLPAHAADDVFLCLNWYRESATVAPPDGWTEAATWLRGTTRYYLHWRRATSASETNPFFASSGVDDAYGLVGVYRGVVTTGNPFDVLGAPATGTANPATLTGITTLTPESLVVALIGGEDNTGTGMTMTGTAPAAYVEHYAESAVGMDGAIAVGEAERRTVGATGDVSADFGASVVGWGGLVLSLIPQPIEGTASITEVADTVVATGTVADAPITGTLAVTEADDTVSATGTVSSDAGLGEAYSPYPWWRPFFIWPQATQLELPDFDAIPHRYVGTTTPMPISLMCGARSRFIRGPRPVVHPVVESTMLQQTVLVNRSMILPAPPRRILTEVDSLVDRLHEQRLRDDDELMLLLPEQH